MSYMTHSNPSESLCPTGAHPRNRLTVWGNWHESTYAIPIVILENSTNTGIWGGEHFASCKLGHGISWDISTGKMKQKNPMADHGISHHVMRSGNKDPTWPDPSREKKNYSASIAEFSNSSSSISSSSSSSTSHSVRNLCQLKLTGPLVVIDSVILQNFDHGKKNSWEKCSAFLLFQGKHISDFRFIAPLFFGALTWPKGLVICCLRIGSQQNQLEDDPGWTKQSCLAEGDYLLLLHIWKYHKFIWYITYIYIYQYVYLDSSYYSIFVKSTMPGTPQRTNNCEPSESNFTRLFSSKCFSHIEPWKEKIAILYLQIKSEMLI